MSDKSEYSDDLGLSSGSDGMMSDAECVEYSVDSDGNIKPDQDNFKKLPKVFSDTAMVRKDDGLKNLSSEERRKKKLLEKLDSRIKNVNKKHDKVKKIQIEPKLIKNK